MYYKFLDKFHVVPNNWIDLFEFISYYDTESKILEYVKQIKDGMK